MRVLTLLWCCVLLMSCQQKVGDVFVSESDAFQLEGAKVFVGEKKLCFKLTKYMKTLKIPRLNNSYRTVTFGDKGPQLKEHIGIDHWTFILPKNNAQDDWVVMHLHEDFCFAPDGFEIAPKEDGSFFIEGRHGIRTGEKIRYEPQHHKNTIGYWVGKKDEVAFKLKVKRATRYELHVFQGCGKGQGGSKARCYSGKSVRDFTVEDTGHFQNFKWRNLGQLVVSPEDPYLRIKPLKIAKNALMDVRYVKLIPVK